MKRFTRLFFPVIRSNTGTDGAFPHFYGTHSKKKPMNVPSVPMFPPMFPPCFTESLFLPNTAGGAI
jgi:hypothetical protein